jgi:hypothetical protein
MKRLLTVVGVAGLLSACGTNSIQSDYAKQAQQQSAQQTANMQAAITQAPEWMFKLPKVDGMVFENGTATSGDFALADMKAKSIAYAKICTAAGGKVRSQTKVFTQDNGTSTVEQSEMAIRNICPDIDISGVETVEMKHVAEGNRIRTYVLVALNKNARSATETKRSSKEAFNELDEITGNKPVGNDSDSTPVTPQKGDSVNVVKPDGTTSTLNLMPVDNAEYKARRDAALQKPGAVVGQTSINN